MHISVPCLNESYMEHGYRDNRDNVLHYCDTGILIIAQPYSGACECAMHKGSDTN